MNINRIYDPAIEEQASMFPRLEFSDADGARGVINERLESLAAEGAIPPIFVH